MPSIHIDKKKSGNYISIVESFRDSNGKPKIKTLLNIGKVEDFRPEVLQNACRKLFVLSGGDINDFHSNEVEELCRINFGYQQIVEHLMAYFGINDICRRIVKRHQLGFDFQSVLILMLIERLNDPCSKLSSFAHKQEYYNMDWIELQWLYRTLDKLDKYSDQIQSQVYSKGRDLFNQKLDIIFYDVTTFYFDSDIEQQGSIRQMGFSKDSKIGKTQIVFGLLIDVHKQPVGYQIFDGNTFEGHTLKVALTELKQRFCLERIIVVADRAMLSSTNIEMVTKELGMKFIFGERLKSMPRKVQEQFINKQLYDKVWVYSNTKEEHIQINYYSAVYKDRRIICTYSAKRARKDKHEREKRIETAQKLLKTPSKIKAKATYHYIKTVGENDYQLNEQKIINDERFDGILAISTNDDKLSDEQVLDQYRHLFQIEHSFRTMKSMLEVRPMYHWTDSRIRGHICLCYLSLAMLRNIQLRLAKQQHTWSENRIITTLDKMQASKVKQNEEIFFMRSALSEDQNTLTQIFKLKPIKPINHNALNIK